MVSEGQPAPDFTLESDAGEQVTLSQFRGTPVVLYFYRRRRAGVAGTGWDQRD